MGADGRSRPHTYVIVFSPLALMAGTGTATSQRPSRATAADRGRWAGTSSSSRAAATSSTSRASSSWCGAPGPTPSHCAPPTSKRSSDVYCLRPFPIAVVKRQFAIALDGALDGVLFKKYPICFVSLIHFLLQQIKESLQGWEIILNPLPRNEVRDGVNF